MIEDREEIESWLRNLKMTPRLRLRLFLMKLRNLYQSWRYRS